MVSDNLYLILSPADKMIYILEAGVLRTTEAAERPLRRFLPGALGP